MRRLAALGVLACLGLIASPAAQDPPASTQIFRTGIDLIQIDVTVVDKNRAPVRGLKAADFTIRENGRPQRVVAVVEMDAAAEDPTPNAWMRHAPRDVATNDLADQLGDGQAVAIVLDDFTIPDDSVEMAVGTRDIARYIVNSLGPSDLAAVVFPFKAGRTQDFTHDRSKLLAAIDKFESEQPEYGMTLQPRYPSRPEGDVQRYSPILGRDPCLQVQPVIPTLRAVTSRLAAVPNRRKALFFISVGLGIQFRPGNSRCQNMIYDEMRKTFETAQRFNVNIHGVDPAGAAGYQRFLQQSRIRNGRMVQGRDLMSARDVAHRRHDFLETLAEQTGGRPVVDSDDLEASIADVFHESSAYYLIGYEATNPEPDGKFRRVEVEVQGREVDVRTRTGRWAPDKGRVVDEEGPRAVTCVIDCWHVPPAPSDFQLAGLMPLQPLRLRAAAYPIARAASSGAGVDEVEIAAVVTVRLGAVLRAADETLALVRTTYDAAGKASRPTQDMFTRKLAPVAVAGGEAQYDIWTRFSLPPGRHSVRFNATSRAADVSGSVFAEIEVPDLSRTRGSASSIVLGLAASAGQESPLASVLPIVPTTARDFTKGERVTAFVRLFAGAPGPAAPVEVSTRILGADNKEALEIPVTAIPVESFETDRSADYTLDLPLSKLDSGLHLLSITAAFKDAPLVRRDLVFRVR